MHFTGITRLPILEGEVSHVEIPRTSASLGLTIVGGSDTPLRCVVVQEVFPDGLVAGDGRLQPGDQIIEINGCDMTCATHAQVKLKEIFFSVIASNSIDLIYTTRDGGSPGVCKHVTYILSLEIADCIR